MNFRRLMLIAAPLALVPGLAAARDTALPRQNLLVELRWARSTESPHARADAPTLSHGAGAANSTTSTSAVTIGTLRDESTPEIVQRLIVLNGESARLSLVDRAPVQWVDYAIDLHAAPQTTPPPPSATPTTSQRRSATKPGAAAVANTLGSSQVEVLAVPRTGSIDRARRIVVGLRWPGGNEPVRVEVSATVPNDGPSVQGQIDLMTIVEVKLGQWQTVGYGQSPGETAQDGTVVSTRDIDAARSRDLQLRVTQAR